MRVGGGSWQVFGNLARPAKVASSWSVPVLGPGGLLGVITVFRAMPGKPRRDDLDLAALYAGYAASAIERDRLLDEVTARNRLLETIREMLQTLAGPVPVEAALRIALQALRRGLDADEVALVAAGPDGAMLCRGYSSAPVTSARRWREGADTHGWAGTGTSDGGWPCRRRCRRGRRRLDRADPDGVAVTGRSASAPCDGTAASAAASTCRSRSPPPTGGPCCSPSGGTAQAGRRDRPARGRGQLAAARARARAGAARAAGGDGAAAVARAAADVPAQAQPRAAHPAHRDHRVRDQPAAAGRHLGRGLAAAVPVPHRGRVRAARPPGQRPARLLHDRVGHPAAERRLVRHTAGARRRRRGAAARGRVRRSEVGERDRAARHLGRPRPA